MDCRNISASLPFKGFDIYNVTSYVQNHTLINRGITTLGGSTVPQCIMSNNKYEAQERALMGGIYFVASYLTPILLIPLYNKHFLHKAGVTKSLEDAGKKIIEVSKQYLTKSGNLKDGLKKTAREFDVKNKNNEYEQAFDEIYKRYNNEDKLKKDLLSVHEKVLMTDFITTGAMWSAIPWIATETTERRLNRNDFSAGFNLKNEEKKSAEEVKKSKREKLFWNVLFSVIPGVLFSKTVTKGLRTDVSKLSKTKNPFVTLKNSALKYIAHNPTKFNYTSGTNMSKTIYASIWVLSSFPAKIISSRDKNERRDRTLRDVGLFTMFFGGDYLINNIGGRIADRIFGTQIMETSKKKLNFLQRFKLPVRNFKNIDSSTGLTPQMLTKTKKIGAGLYWFSLFTNTALIGFAMPKILNKILRYNIAKDNKVEHNLDIN